MALPLSGRPGRPGPLQVDTRTLDGALRIIEGIAGDTTGSLGFQIAVAQPLSVRQFNLGQFDRQPLLGILQSEQCLPCLDFLPGGKGDGDHLAL